MNRFMIVAGFIISLCLFGLASAADPIVSQLPDGTKYISNQVLIMLEDGFANSEASQQVLNAALSVPGVAGIEPFYKGNLRKPCLKAVASKIYRIALNDNINAAYYLEPFKAIEGLRYAEIQYVPKLYYTPNDPYIDQYWHLEQTHVYEAWDYVRGDTTRHSVIGIVDCGINYRQADIEPNIWINELEDINHDGYFDSSDSNGVDDDGNGFVDDVIGWNFTSDNNDPNGSILHGTAVASCASEATDNGLLGAGAGFSARLMCLKAITDQGHLGDAYAGLLYAADNGAQIVNCSWGVSTYSEIEQNIINAVWEADVLIIAGGGDADMIAYPAAYENVIAVSPTDDSDHITPFAPMGEYVDICAPGVDIRVIDGETVSRVSGTSFATGIVSGIAALVRTWYPSYTNDQIWQVIADGADDISGLNPGHEDDIGVGRINAANCILTGIDDEPVLPSETRLLNCYPNPFNAATTIKFELSSASTVTINIYDILGRKVDSLKPGRQQAGSHDIVWDAGELPSGIYFARLTNQDKSEVLKMILLK